MPGQDAVETTNDQPKERDTAQSPPTRSSSIPVLLSGLALLLAVFALAATLINNQNMGARHPLDDIKRQLNAMESRVNHVEALMATDKHGLVQAKLKKMLLNLHELSRLGDAATRSEISKVEAILLRLSSPATRIKVKVDLKSVEKSEIPAKKKIFDVSPASHEHEPQATAIKSPEKPTAKTANPPSLNSETDTAPTALSPTEK